MGLTIRRARRASRKTVMRSLLVAFCLVILACTASASPIDSQDQEGQWKPGFEKSSSHGVDVNNHDRDGDVELGHHDRGDDHDPELGNHDRDDNDAGDIDIEVGDHDGQGSSGGDDTHVVPEPSTLALAGLGIVGVAISGRRR